MEASARLLVWFQGSSGQLAVSLRTAPRADQPPSSRPPPDNPPTRADPPFKGLTDVNNSVAAFMLIRGPHAFLGWSWVSCSGDCFTELKDCPPPPGNQIHYDITLGGLVGPDCKHARAPSSLLLRSFLHALLLLRFGPLITERCRADGEPTELCHETAPGSEVFVREWSKATVEVDCKGWTSRITMK